MSPQHDLSRSNIRIGRNDKWQSRACGAIRCAPDPGTPASDDAEDSKMHEESGVDVKLSWIPASTTLDRWHVEDGSMVKRDMLLLTHRCDEHGMACEFDWPAPCSGVIRIVVAAGSPVRRNDVVAEIEPIEEPPPSLPPWTALPEWFLNRRTP